MTLAFSGWTCDPQTPLHARMRVVQQGNTLRQLRIQNNKSCWYTSRVTVRLMGMRLLYRIMNVMNTRNLSSDDCSSVTTQAQTMTERAREQTIWTVQQLISSRLKKKKKTQISTAHKHTSPIIATTMSQCEHSRRSNAKLFHCTKALLQPFQLHMPFLINVGSNRFLTQMAEFIQTETEIPKLPWANRKGSTYSGTGTNDHSCSFLG